MNNNMPAIVVLVGITGDLTKRKLLPAIEALGRSGNLPTDFRLLGTSRRENVNIKNILPDGFSPDLAAKLEVFTIDTENFDEYARLSEKLIQIEKELGSPAQRLFYLSVPPSASEAIIKYLGMSGLAAVPNTKLLLEKPFGMDIDSAKKQITNIDSHFTSEQVYRIDHYLAKEMSRNLVVFREYTSLFKQTWNNKFIDRIEVTAKEKIGIEGRSDFYEQTGALRDLVQSHLLQLTALMLMKTKSEQDQNLSLQDETQPLRRLEALKQLQLSSTGPVSESVVRGQYKSYRTEVQNPESVVETYVSLKLESNDPNFTGIPIILTTGKMLSEKVTEIHIFYKKESDREANELVLHIQPDEGISMPMWSKKPGYEDTLEKSTLEFAYATHQAKLPDAYEKVFIDAMRSDHQLFISNQEVLEAWRILTPVQEAWKKSTNDLVFYENGSKEIDILSN